MSLNRSFRKSLSNRMHVGYIYPDDTSIIEWYYIFRSYFIDNNNDIEDFLDIFYSDETQEILKNIEIR